MNGSTDGCSARAGEQRSPRRSSRLAWIIATCDALFIAAIASIVGAGRASGQQPTPADSMRADSVQRARVRALTAAADSAAKARADSLRRYNLKAVVVTATRLSAASKEVPAEVEALDLPLVIPGPEAATTALANLPGVSTYNDQGTPFQPHVEVRGFTVSPVVGSPQGVSVFLNGVRVNEPDAQEVNFDLLPMAAVDSASLVRGPDILFGRNSLGGTLLFDTQRGTATPEANVEWGGGSFGEQTVNVTAGGKLDGIDGFLAGMALDETGWRQATSGETRNLFATIGHQWGPTRDSGDVALDVLYGKDKIYEAGSLPSSYASATPQLNYTPGDFFAPEAYLADVRGNQLVGGGILRETVFYRHNDVEQYNGNVPPPNTDSYITTVSKGGTIEWTRAFQVGVPVGLTVGIDYQTDSVHFALYSDYSDTPGAADTIGTLADVTPQTNVAEYGQAVFSLTSRLKVTAGLRNDYVSIPYIDELDDSNSATNAYHRLSPELGVVYDVTDNAKVYAGYKSGFRAPAPLELACASPTAPCSLPSSLGSDPALSPVTSQDYEAGADWNLPHQSFIDVDGFWTNVDNDIVYASPTLTQVYFVNVPKTRRAGVELSGQLGFRNGARVFGSYSYVAATFQSVVQIASADSAPAPTKPGAILPNSPLNRWRVGAGLHRSVGSLFFDGQFALNGVSGFYQQGDEANQGPEIPGYSVADLSGRVTFRRVGVQFEIENLFNNFYYTYAIEGENGLIPPGSLIPLETVDSPYATFLTPSLPRRFALTVSAGL
jgi:iron complex outermembrane recepter protein